MIETDPLWIGIGLTAQAAFSARFLVQWALSERARRSLLPVHFWLFSVIGSTLLLAYAAHQRDAVIALGQAVGLAIYLRNIELVRRAECGHALSFVWPSLALLAGALAAGLLSHAGPLSAAATRAVPLMLLIGFIGQVLFTGRFVVQLYYSERAQASANPVQFWYLSISGSLLLLAYAISTGDLVIILGQSFGMVVYLRNLRLIHKHHRRDRHGEGATAAADAPQVARQHGESPAAPIHRPGAAPSPPPA